MEPGILYRHNHRIELFDADLRLVHAAGPWEAVQYFAAAVELKRVTSCEKACGLRLVVDGVRLGCVSVMSGVNNACSLLSENRSSNVIEMKIEIRS